MASEDAGRPGENRPAPVTGAIVERPGGALERAGDPPVVARFVVEIRSDGSQSVVRGRLEDHTDAEVPGGQVVEIEARAGSPVGLVVTLWKALVHVVEGPRHLGDFVRGLLPGGKKR